MRPASRGTGALSEDCEHRRIARMKRIDSLKSRAVRINKIFTRVYGRKRAGRRRGNPLDTLILTILSQNTNDRNRDRAYRALVEKYPTWEKLLQAEPREVARIIRVGGLANIKSQRIIEALKFIEEQRGELDLDFLKHKPPEEAEAWLSQMKGVGPKTAAIVMLFTFGMPAFPVDTHVHRVTMRLGLIGKKTTRENAQKDLALLVPKWEYYNFHINLIEHGRAICVARKPRCAICPVRRLCDYYRSVFLKGQS